MAEDEIIWLVYLTTMTSICMGLSNVLIHKNTTPRYNYGFTDTVYAT